MNKPAKRWYRKAQVATRYESCGRTIDRAVEDGRLPPPKFPLGNKVPYWDGDELDAHDRNLAARAHACSISEFQLSLRRSASGYFGPCRANKMPGPAVNGNRAIGITAAMKNLAWPIEFGDTENRFNSDFDLENSKIFAADVACAPAPPINSPTNSNFPTPISKNTAAPAHALAWGRP
jgi:hypothetical protein